MSVTEALAPVRSECAGMAAWPQQVNLIMSALEAGRSVAPAIERRQPRARYRVLAMLRLFNEPAGTPPWLLYSRDVSSRSLGFVTPHRLPLGYGGSVELPAPNGQTLIVHCTLFRCREAAPGWYEGALSFNRDQWIFASGDE